MGRDREEPPVAGEPAAPKPGSDQFASPDLGKVDFSGFILSLAQSVLIDLGATPHPESGETEKNLEQACQTIDIIAMLQEKTQGNLSPDEQQLISGTLYQLRISFVKAKKGE